MDSQCVKTTEARGPRGYDAAKETKGHKRHALVETDGRALLLQVSAVDVQDRDSAVPLLRTSRRWFPYIERVFADTAYAGSGSPMPRASSLRLCVSCLRRWAGFAVLPHRWEVKRFFAWLGRNRRLAKGLRGEGASRSLLWLEPDPARSPFPAHPRDPDAPVHQQCRGCASFPTSVLSGCGCGTDRVAERRLSVVWSGTRSFRPSRLMIEDQPFSLPIGKTERSAQGQRRQDHQRRMESPATAGRAWFGSQAANASSVNHTVRLRR